MNNTKNTSEYLLNKAYKCKSTELENLLQEIELAIQKSEKKDNVLLRAKTVVTSKLAVNNCK